MTDNKNPRGKRASGRKGAPRPEAAAREPVADAFARHDVSTLLRLREYQASIERASDLLTKVQPDLVAGEMMPIEASEPRRSRWPLIIAMSLSGLVWIGVAWAVRALA